MFCPETSKRVMSPQTKEKLPLKEKLSLLHDLEKAEARVKALEAQVKTLKN